MKNWYQRENRDGVRYQRIIFHLRKITKFILRGLRIRGLEQRRERGRDKASRTFVIRTLNPSNPEHAYHQCVNL